MPSYSTESSEEDVSEEDNQNYINDLSASTVYDDNYNNFNNLYSAASMQIHIEKYTLMFGLILGLRYCCGHLN